jgi:starvation-inducible DNA-binding protein
MFKTKNDLSEEIRAKAVELLNGRLADCIDLQTQTKQAHWDVKGPNFIAPHELFDGINEEVEDYVDDIAERSVQLVGVAEGTARMVVKRSTLREYPAHAVGGHSHVDALSAALARKAIDPANELGDLDVEPDVNHKAPPEVVERENHPWLHVIRLTEASFIVSRRLQFSPCRCVLRSDRHAEAFSGMRRAVSFPANPPAGPDRASPPLGHPGTRLLSVAGLQVANLLGVGPKGVGIDGESGRMKDDSETSCSLPSSFALQCPIQGKRVSRLPDSLSRRR